MRSKILTSLIFGLLGGVLPLFIYINFYKLKPEVKKKKSALELIDAGADKQKVLSYFIKSIIQVSNHPTGEVKGELDYIEFENWLWKNGIRLPNEDDPNNQYPNEDSYDY